MVDRALKDTATVSMSRDLDEIGGNRVIDELIVFRDQLVQALLDDLTAVSVEVHDQATELTWFPFRSLMSATTFILSA